MDLSKYKDTSEKIKEIAHIYGLELIENQKYKEASKIFEYSSDSIDGIYMQYCNMMSELTSETEKGNFVNLTALLKQYDISLTDVIGLKEIEKNQYILDLFELEGSWLEDLGTVTLTFKDGMMYYNRKSADYAIVNGQAERYNYELSGAEMIFYLYADNGEIVPTSDENVASRENRPSIEINRITINWRDKRFDKIKEE